jgi:hypothetical protein
MPANDSRDDSHRRFQPARLSPDEGTGHVCPFCAAIVICVDRTRTILHAAPVCEAFKKKMEAFGIASRLAPWVAVQRPDACDKQ